MVFDLLDGFTFTTAGVGTATSDKTGVTIAATTTATYFSDALDLKSGGTGISKPVNIAVRYASALTNAAGVTGANFIRFDLQTSADGTTFYDRTDGQVSQIPLTTTAQSGIVNLPLVTEQRYARLKIYVDGAGSSPTPGVVVNSADLIPFPL